MSDAHTSGIRQGNVGNSKARRLRNSPCACAGVTPSANRPKACRSKNGPWIGRIIAMDDTGITNCVSAYGK
jgi:hypothetical protein